MHAKPSSRLLLAYGEGLFAIAVGLFFRWYLSPLLGDRAMYSTYLPAVMVAAYFGGLARSYSDADSRRGPELFIDRTFFAFELKGVGDSFAMGLFLLTGAFISVLAELLHRTQHRLLAERARRGEAALRQTEDRFRALVQNSSDIICIFAADGTILYLTPSVKRVLGFSPEDRIGKNMYGEPIIHPDDIAATRKFIETVLSSPSIASTIEFRLRHVDGSWRDIEAIVQSFLDEPSVGGLVASYRDITDRKRAEVSTRKSERQWQDLTEALPQLVWSATPDGACDYFSTQWTEHTGIPETHLLGWQWLETLHPDDRDVTRKLWINSVAGHGAYDVEYRVRRSDGEYRWFKTRGVPIQNSTGNVVKWFGTCTDFTDAKLAEEEFACQRVCRVGQPSQGRIPGKRQSRDSHAYERYPRNDAPSSKCAARKQSAAMFTDRQDCGRQLTIDYRRFA